MSFSYYSFSSRRVESIGKGRVSEMGPVLEAVSKYTLIICNIIITILGLVCFVFMVADVSKHKRTITDLDSTHLSVTNLIISVFLLVATGFAWCGTFRRHRCSLLTYALMMMIMGILQAIASVVLITSLDGVVRREEPRITKSLNQKYKEYSTNKEIRDVLDDMHIYYECCGAEKPIKIDELYPYSCCKYLDNGKCMNPYKRGCVTVVARSTVTKIKTAMIILLCAALFEIIAGISAILYRKTIEADYL